MKSIIITFIFQYSNQSSVQVSGIIYGPRRSFSENFLYVFISVPYKSQKNIQFILS